MKGWNILKGVDDWFEAHHKVHTVFCYIAGLAIGIGIGYHFCLLKQMGIGAGISVFALLGL